MTPSINSDNFMITGIFKNKNITIILEDMINSNVHINENKMVNYYDDKIINLLIEIMKINLF